MQVEKLIVGQLQANCYAVINSDKDTLIIDPGADGNRIVAWLTDLKVKPVAILLTHGHFDHIGASDTLREIYQIPLYINEREKDWLTNGTLNLSVPFGFPAVTVNPADNFWTEAGPKNVAGFNFDLLMTPGHTPGSVCYYFPDSKLLFTGDLLFKNSIGRTDFPEGNPKDLFTAIRDQVLTLPDETIIYSGHGEATDIKSEKENNPFLQYF